MPARSETKRVTLVETNLAGEYDTVRGGAATSGVVLRMS